MPAFGLGFPKMSSSNIKKVTDLLALTAEATKNCGKGKNRSKFAARKPMSGLEFPKLSLKFLWLKY